MEDWEGFFVDLLASLIVGQHEISETKHAVHIEDAVEVSLRLI